MVNTVSDHKDRERDGDVVLEVRGMDKSFGPTVALRDVSLAVRRGEIRGLIGENGSGKSTVSSICAGMQRADRGEIYFKGKRWEPSSMVDAMEHGFGMIVQEAGTVPDITVAENIFLGQVDRFKVWRTADGRRCGPVDGRALNDAAQAALDEIGASHIDARTVTSSLDLQDRKLVEIAKVWMQDPELIVVDETTTALSRRGREIIYGLMDRMREKHGAVLLISHDLDEIMEHCTALTVLRDGVIVRTFDRAGFDPDAIRTAMIGREMQGNYYRDDASVPERKKKAIEAAGLARGHRVRDCSLTLWRGEILGIGGLSHCGMHELGKILFGAMTPEHGHVRVFDENGAAHVISSVGEAMERGIGYVAKDRDVESLSTAASIRDNVSVVGLDRLRGTCGVILRSRESAYVREQIGRLSTKYFSIDQPVSELSGGNKQKVVFARWLGRGSDILILDCPTRGVDIGVKQAMYRLMYEMRERGTAILMISEEMTELMGMCDRLLVMKDGKVTRELERRNGFDENEIIRYMI